jgi:superfamily I DNA/RNA helicase
MRLLASVNPTPEQLSILTDSRPGFRLIRGAAGSGKTTTALLRLRQLCRSRLSRRARLDSSAPVRVLVLTFNRTLEGYIAELVRSQISHQPGLVAEVSTFSRWARQLAPDLEVLDRDQTRAMLRPNLSALVSDSRTLDFMVDEIEYVLSKFPTEKLENYISTERTGRGQSPRVTHATRQLILDEVISPYRQAKVQKGVGDWNDLALAATFTPGPDQTYDVVIVDEAQDFSANQVRAILSHLAADHSTTFILDAAQRVYARHFTWAEVGIGLRPNEIFHLRANHRNTVQIAAFAAPLVIGLPVEDDGTIPDFAACQEVGPIPKLISGRYSDQFKFMLDSLLGHVDLTSESVAILQPRAGRWFDFVRSELHNRRIPFCELTRKSAWPSGPENIAICTIHSAKGLEFDHVLIPGLNQQVTPHGDGSDDATLDRLRRLLAMGIGRARRSVMIGYKFGEQSTLISLLDPATYELIKL